VVFTAKSGAELAVASPSAGLGRSCFGLALGGALALLCVCGDARREHWEAPAPPGRGGGTAELGGSASVVQGGFVVHDLTRRASAFGCFGGRSRSKSFTVVRGHSRRLPGEDGIVCVIFMSDVAMLVTNVSSAMQRPDSAHYDPTSFIAIARSCIGHSSGYFVQSSSRTQRTRVAALRGVGGRWGLLRPRLPPASVVDMS